MKINAMRHLSSTVFLMTFSGPCLAFGAQPPAAVPPPATAQTAIAQTATLQTTGTPSAIMQPSLDTLKQTLGTLRPDKWKASSAAREETAANISSIGHDLQTMLPPLLTAADAAPDSVAQLLPAFRNIEALYDVLLRVAATGNLSAPSQQNAALEQARASLEDGRRALGDRLASAALAQERQVRSLQAAVRAIPPAPAPVDCTPPPPAKKRRPRKKAVTKPAPAPASTPSGAAASH